MRRVCSVQCDAPMNAAAPSEIPLGIERAYRMRAYPTRSQARTLAQLAYKARWSGRTLSVVDRWYPSSKACSACGAVNKALTLNQRYWTCPSCGAEHDRDFNAAVNIEREGLRLLAESNTPMSGGIDAHGDLGAVAGALIIALPQHRRPLNRESIARRCAPNRSRRRSGTGGEGGSGDSE